jgi:exodeoxyribonuclease VII large subunit
MSKNAISLFELNQQLKVAIQESFPKGIWIRAEIAELRENRNGHCYLDLVEKDDASDQVIARMKAMIWSYTYRMLKPYFETSTGRPLTQGIKVLVQGVPEFQEVFGLSLIIRDIDPTYTLGDLEQRRREVISRLENEGVLSMNKELALPTVPQKIAIISSPTAAGYGDFIDQLNNNHHQIKFYYKLFSAIMQGDQAPESITNAFDKIYEQQHLFDVVVIIRGGGASLDLLCFDDYWLAYNITQFPLPVLTGIGHERDMSVADIVAHTNLKTPTAVAEFLISGANRILELTGEYTYQLEQIISRKLSKHNQKLERLSYTFAPLIYKHLQSKKHLLNRLTEKLPLHTNSFVERQKAELGNYALQLSHLPENTIRYEENRLKTFYGLLRIKALTKIKTQKQKISFLETNNRLNDPQQILLRGYSLTYKNGVVIKNADQIMQGDFIETRFKEGRSLSEVKETGL